MYKKAIPLMLAALVFVFLLASCINLEQVQKVNYALQVEEEEGTKKGHLNIQLEKIDEKNYQTQIHFALGEESFSSSFRVNADDVQSSLLPLMFSNPSIAKTLGILSASQGFLTPILAGGTFNEGFQWKQKDQEGETEISIPSSEERFGRKALWVEVKKDGKLVARMLLEKATFFPLVVDFQDPEQLESGQKRFYMEAKEVTWK